MRGGLPARGFRWPGGGRQMFARALVLLGVLVGLARAAQEDEGDLTVEWPSNNPEIRMLQVMSSIRHRYARTHVTSEITNHVADIKEAVFNFWIPKEASITNFSMVVDDHEYVGEVKEKTQAQRQFQPSSRLRGHITTPDDLSTSRDAHGFRVTVQVPPKKSVTFHLTYEELLKRKRGRYEHVIMLNPEQVIRDLSVDVNIEEPREITQLAVPALRFNASTLSEYQSEVGDVVSISRPTRSSAAISFRPSVRQQLLYSPSGIMGRLFVVYDVKRALDVGDISTGRNFFMHFFAPVGIATYPKTVLFLVDTSGSMQGPKISQTKAAMTDILASLDQADTFNIITFSTWLRFWKQDGMAGASAANIAAAKKFINDISVSGGTNMNDALVRGLDMLKGHMSSRSSSIPLIFLLADGEPTSGITNNDLILENVRIGNTVEARIVTLGYGDDINAQFLQRLASKNRGIYRQIYEDADSAIQIQNAFQEVSTLVLKDVRFDYGDSLIEGTQSHSEVPNYWKDSEIVVGGYFKDHISVLVPDIHGYSVNGHMAFNDRIRVRQSQPGADFIERSWALLTIKTLLEKAKQTSNSTLKGTSNTRALALALQYSFVTPLTTMVVKNPGARNTNVGYLRDVPVPARRRGRGNNRGSQGTQGRGVNYPIGPRTTPFVDNDPHFVVQVAGIRESICFDISGRPGQVMQLIHDNITGVVVNGLVVGKTPKDPEEHMRTYFGHIQIMAPGNNISATIKAILVNDVRVDWRRAPPRVIEGIEVNMKSHREAVFSIAPGLEFTVLRHIVNKPNPVKVDFLGFYIKDGSALSEKTHGLIGQFQNQHVTLESPPVIIKKKRVVKLKFTGPNSRKNPVKARMRRRRNMETKRHVPCWHVPHSGEGLIHGLPIDYIVPNLDFKRFCMAEKLKDRTFPLFHFS